uniref:Reverse transcriptase Ty1/copia-type domain-containing protein n=1 Tax=Glossina austeni TaxID=7395 RepID=A0A1A9URW6_GLOAU
MSAALTNLENNLLRLDCKDDDIIILAIYVEDIKQLVTKLAKSFRIEDLIPLKFYLGTEFKEDINTETTIMSQTNIYECMNNILNRFEMENYWVIKTPLDQSIKQFTQMSREPEDEQQEVESIPHQNPNPQFLAYIAYCAIIMLRPMNVNNYLGNIIVDNSTFPSLLNDAPTLTIFLPFPTNTSSSSLKFIDNNYAMGITKHQTLNVAIATSVRTFQGGAQTTLWLAVAKTLKS